ncbi:MAG: hypothetical protein K2P17_03980 [Helicobacteraceae bacterium]|nr:hypothetical protein [Helicobacteraceae bacterium]
MSSAIDVSAFNGGSSSSTSSTGGTTSTGGLGASLDLSGATIQGHTINDGLDAKETAQLFNSILNNTANTIAQGASNTLNNITSSTGFKVIIIGIVGFIAYKFFFKKGKK